MHRDGPSGPTTPSPDWNPPCIGNLTFEWPPHLGDAAWGVQLPLDEPLQAHVHCCMDGDRQLQLQQPPQSCGEQGCAQEPDNQCRDVNDGHAVAGPSRRPTATLEVVVQEGAQCCVDACSQRPAQVESCVLGG